MFIKKLHRKEKKERRYRKKREKCSGKEYHYNKHIAEFKKKK